MRNHTDKKLALMQAKIIAKQLRAGGDARGPLTTVSYDWTVIAEKGILKTFSRVMKPIFCPVSSSLT